MIPAQRGGRLSTVAAAFVIARRDFTAILFSRSFIFFLLGPLFPVLVGAMAGGVGQQVQQSTSRAVLGLAMPASENRAMIEARAALAPHLGGALPEFVVVRDAEPGAFFDARTALASKQGNVGAVLTGSAAAPVLVGTSERIAAWQGPVSLVAAQAAGSAPPKFPTVALQATATSKSNERHGRVVTAQAAQTLLFLLTMLLAGMVLSNLVEEKGNKIIEILAAAIPMDAVFLGKLFAMLAISFVGIGVWFLAAALFSSLIGQSLATLPVPAVGWPMFFALGIVYFASAYLVLGAVFLTVGSMASTVREVQTLSMPVTMMQLMVFFLASYAMTQPGSGIEAFAIIFPFSSPFAMLARAAQDADLWPHALALIWQAFCVVLFIRIGARLFRTRVMKSGPARVRRKRRLVRFPVRTKRSVAD